MKDKDFLLEVPLVDQFKNTDDPDWRLRSCGICVLKMLMVFKNQGFSSISVGRLIEQAFGAGGYMENVGWKHQSLVDLGKEYGLDLQYQKVFFKTSEEKDEGIKIITSELNKKRPVVVSIFRDFNSQNSGHLVVLVGFKLRNREVSGFYIQDPDPRERGNNYFVGLDEFKAGWRGGMIWFEN